MHHSIISVRNIIKFKIFEITVIVRKTNIQINIQVYISRSMGAAKLLWVTRLQIVLTLPQKKKNCNQNVWQRSPFKNLRNNVTLSIIYTIIFSRHLIAQSDYPRSSNTAETPKTQLLKSSKKKNNIFNFYTEHV